MKYGLTKFFSGTFSLAAVNELYAEANELYIDTESMPYTFIPGVYGFGMDTRGPFTNTDTPTILHVDTLSGAVVNTDDTHGSFAWCVTRDFPRIVVFDVAGVIEVDGNIEITSSDFWIAGQSAPGRVCIHSNRTVIFKGCSDGAIQHMFLRRREENSTDVMNYSKYSTQRRVHVINCSISWGSDENLSSGSQEMSDHVEARNFDLTWAKNIIAQGIQDHSCGGLVQTDRHTIAQNFYVHNHNRNPGVGVRSYQVAVFNNLVYNWGYAPTHFTGRNSSDGPHGRQEVHQVCNYYKKGPHTGTGCAPETYFYIYGNGTDEDNYLKCRDNVYEGTLYADDSHICNSYDVDYTVPEEVTIPNYSILDPFDVPAHITKVAGAWPAFRDSHDATFISDYENGEGVVPDSVPALDTSSFETISSTFVPVENPFDMYDDNYTRIEKQLHDCAYYVENGSWPVGGFNRKGQTT